MKNIFKVSRFMSPAKPVYPESTKERQLGYWPYQDDEGDFLSGKTPDFFPDSFEEEE